MGFPIIKFRFKLGAGYYPNLKDPQSFNEKCTYKKNSRNPVFPKNADKYKGRKYVKEKIGENYLIPQLQVVDIAEDINFDVLPSKFVIKTNFSSGQNIIIHNKGDADLEEIRKN